MRILTRKIKVLIAIGKYILNFRLRHKKLKDERFKCEWRDRLPCLNDTTDSTTYDAHYVFHTAWAARILAKNKPIEHVDIGSCFRFVTLISAFVPIRFFDYRPISIRLSGLNSSYADITKLPFPDNSIQSLSCMHVVEHIGLERYGDSFSPKGDIIAMHELERVLIPGGILLFVVPVGEVPRIQYNAHRIYTTDQIISYFGKLTLLEFSLVKDNGSFESPSETNNTIGQQYGCGCFMFTKNKILKQSDTDT